MHQKAITKFEIHSSLLRQSVVQRAHHAVITIFL